MKLKLKEAKILKLTKYPGENGTTQVLEVAANLTPPLAEQFRCREACYTDEGVPRHFEAYPSPALRINGGDVVLGDLTARAKLIHKFKIVQPKTGGNNDVTLDVHVRLHFEGALPIGIWVDEQNKTPFLLDIKARQEDLAFGGDEPDEENEEEEAPPIAAVAEPTEVASIASAREAAGGTHQRRRPAAEAQPVQ